MIALDLFNAEEMIFSDCPASEGGHRGLVAIPGSALWGAAAGRCYVDAAISSDETFGLLHSGRVRISPGFPLTPSGKPAFPMPQLLQEPKHARGGIARSDETAGAADESGRITESVWNMRFGPLQADSDRVQTEALKHWHLAGDGSVVRPTLRERGKSSIIEGDRRVEAQQFFQYAHLPAGRHSRVWIDADDPADAELLAERLARGTLRLGRSRQREFGGVVTVTRLEASDDPREAGFAGTGRGELSLWCLSDLALVDRYGTANLAPEPQDFGIPGFTGRLCSAASVISTRRYAPYNQHLGGRDREHAVIAAGSVLIYRLDADLPLSVFRGGVGLWRERGLGLLWPDCDMLSVPRPARIIIPGTVVAAAPPAQSGRSERLSAAEEALLQVVEARAGKSRTARMVADLAAELARSLAASLQRVERRGDEVPGPSQWSRVAEAADRSISVAELRTALFGEKGLCVGTANSDWKGIRADFEAVTGNRDESFLPALSRAAREVARDRKRGASH
jgi:hypothetical protein